MGRYYFWTHGKIVTVQKLPVVQSAPTAPIACSARGEKFLFV